jgi:hypothetical protein
MVTWLTNLFTGVLQPTPGVLQPTRPDADYKPAPQSTAIDLRAVAR